MSEGSPYKDWRLQEWRNKEGRMGLEAGSKRIERDWDLGFQNQMKV